MAVVQACGPIWWRASVRSERLDAVALVGGIDVEEA